MNGNARLQAIFRFGTIYFLHILFKAPLGSSYFAADATAKFMRLFPVTPAGTSSGPREGRQFVLPLLQLQRGL